MHADAVRLPGAQRVAALRVLEFHDLGPEIGKLEADHIAGNEARHVDDPHTVERTGRFRRKRSLRQAHRSALILRLLGAVLCWIAFCSPTTTASTRRVSRFASKSPP